MVLCPEDADNDDAVELTCLTLYVANSHIKEISANTLLMHRGEQPNTTLI